MSDTSSLAGSLVMIDASGDLFLDLEDDIKSSIYRFRVSAAKLRNVSIYFRNLLDPAKFAEGVHVAARLGTLKAGDDGTLDEAELPVVRIADIPNPSTNSSSYQEALQCFFEAVHEASDEAKAQRLPSKKLPMSFIMRLAIVADRFLALGSIKPCIDAYHRLQQPSKEASRLMYSLANETYWRQRLLVGIWFGYTNWVFAYSRLLIQHGSEYWLRIESGEEEQNLDAAPWGHLPNGLEEEMMHRRACILTTVASLQNFFLERFMSGKRQCRLGYDSSPQCDSFQLGEMVRFFNKRELLNVQSSIDGQDWRGSYNGNLPSLLKLLRQCPTYQIDSNHAHCGIRTLLVPRAEYLESWVVDPLHVGICLRCWRSTRHESSWLDNPSQEPWRWTQRSFLNSSTPHCDRQHKAMRDVFTAGEKDWSPESAHGTAIGT